MSAWARWAWLVAALALAQAQDANISVVWKQLTFEETYELVVNTSVEYILPFVPSVSERRGPVRVWVRAGGGDTARPLLVTARRGTGASTWQVPYRSGDAVLYELQRTLCPDDSVQHDDDALADDCEESTDAPGQLSLHIGSSCAASTTVQLRASFVPDWELVFESSTLVQTVQGAPQVHYYRFPAEQEQVRLVVSSTDDVCATVAVQNYTCPIAETLDDIEQLTTVRMTVQRSGGMQLSRLRYPRGFYVVTLVRDSDEACRPAAAGSDEAWLWRAALLQDGPALGYRPPPRNKTLTIRTQAALSRAQYAAGAMATLALFALFYVGFGGVVLAQRLPSVRRLVGPRAVLARKPDDGTRSEVESAMSTRLPRRRRDSTATFDSSDNSDTDEEEGETVTATTVATATTGPTAAAVGDSNTIDTDNVAASTNNAAASKTFTNSTNSGRNSTKNGGNINNVVPASDVSVVTAGDVHTAADNYINTVVDNDVLRVPDDQTPNNNGIYVINDAIETDEVHAGAGAGAGAGAAVGTGAGAGAGAFGLPARLRLAALARRRARVLSARSSRYTHSVWTVGVFYALPVLQFVAAFQIILNVSGSLDVCYYNFLCAHPVGALADFNHVVSNAGYLLLGALFMLQVRRRRLRRKRKPRDEEYGIPAHYGLLSSLGAAMMMVALLSAAYHVCPNGLNFQFDTAFMYVLAVLSMVKLYQARHPDVNARAHATFGALALLIALVVWGVLGGGPLFWSVVTVLHVFTVLLLSLRIYYVGQFRLEKESLQRAARSLAARPLRELRPLYTARLVMLLIANAVNWGFALYGLFTQSADFAGHLLGVLLSNTLLHMAHYLTMKLLHGERPRGYAWLQLAAAAAAWPPALYFFTSGSTDWSTTAALSRHLNHECRVLQFYDSHDLWHILSAIALYFSFNAMLTWDDGLTAVKRTEIAVF